MALYKNVASQKWVVFAFNETTGVALTGDAAQITAKISKDGAAGGALTDTNPTELEDGYYVFDLTQAETNADLLLLLPESSTANIAVVGVPGACYTQPGNVYDRLGAPAGASIAADIATIDTVVDGIQTDLDNGTDGLGAIKADTAAILVDTADIQPKLGTITDLGGGATVGANLSDMAGSTFDTSTDSQEAIRNRGDAAWTTGAGGSDRLLMVDTTIATLASQTSFTLTAGSADDDAYNNCTIVVEDASTSTQKAVGMVLDYVGATKTVTLKEALAFTIAATDKVYILAENSLKSTVANRQLDVSATGDANANLVTWLGSAPAGLVGSGWVKSDLSSASAGVINAAVFAAGAVDANALATDAVNEIRDAILADSTPFNGADVAAILTDTGTTIPGVLGTPAGADMSADIAAVKSDTAAILVDTADMQPKLGTPAGASISADIATIDANVDAVLVDTGTTIPATLGTPAGADMSADIAAVKADTAATLVDTNELQGDLTDGGRLDLLIDAIKVVTDALGATAAARLALSAGQMIPFTVDTATNGHTPTTTEFQADDITEATADHYNGRVVIFTSGALAGQATDITDYSVVGGIGQFTVTATTEAAANNDTGIII